MTDQSTNEVDHDLHADALDIVEFEATEYLTVEEPEVPPELDQRTGPVARYDERHNVLWIGSMPIPFRIGESRNGELLELLAATIRHLRGIDETDPCPLRRSELRLLAELLDLSDPDLRLQLRSKLAISRRQAGDTVSALRRVLDDREMQLH